MEVDVKRIQVAYGQNLIAWSEDGDISVTALRQMKIMSAQDISENRKLEFSILEADGAQEYRLDAKLPSKSLFNVSDPTAPIFLQAEWSPTGMSQTRGCFLGQLTNKFRVTILHNLGSISRGKWSLRFDLTADLWSKTDAPLSCITAISWSRKIDDEHSVWGHSILYLGDQTGHLHRYKVASDDFEYLGATKVAGAGITKLATYRDKVCALTTKNRLVVVDAQDWNQTPAKWDLDAGYVSSIKATEKAVLLAQPGKVLEVGVEVRETKLPFTECVVNIATRGNGWAVLSAKGNLYSKDFNLPNLEVALGSGIGRKRIIGFVEHPVQPFIAYAYQVFPTHGLYSPVVTDKAATVGLMPTGFPSFTHSSCAPSRALWEFSYLSKEEPNISNVEVTAPSLEEPFAKILSRVVQQPALLALRVQEYFGLNSNIAKIRGIIADTLLAYYGEHGDLSDIDRAILRSYEAYSANNTIECPDVVAVRNTHNNSSSLLPAIVEEFDFKAQPQANTEVVESLSGRKWKRCSLTLLPLLSTSSVVSTTGKFTALKPNAAEIADSKVGQALATLDFCIYDGSRWFDRGIS